MLFKPVFEWANNDSTVFLRRKCANEDVTKHTKLLRNHGEIMGWDVPNIFGMDKDIYPQGN